METIREVKTDPEVTNFMKLHNISAGHAIELMGNYYSHNKAATTWEPTAEEELVELVNLDFEREERISAFYSPER